jgi:pyruvate/2-oxoacid:ferredoxin oxidoreductase beta subunit
LHRPATFTVTLVAMPGVDAIKALRMLLKAALRTYGLRAIDVREDAPAHENQRASAQQPGSTTMSEFSKRVRSQKKGFFRVADLEGGEKTLTIDHLDEEMEVFGEVKDILNFQETAQQLQLNQTTSEWLLDNLGDDPEKWNGKQVTLYLAEYEYNKKKDLGIRLKLPGTAPAKPKPTASSKPPYDDGIPF